MADRYIIVGAIPCPLDRAEVVANGRRVPLPPAPVQEQAIPEENNAVRFFVPQVPDYGAVWDPKKLFLTFGEELRLSPEDILNYFNEQYGHCVQTVTVSQDRNGYYYGSLILRNDCHHCNATHILGTLPSKFVKIKGKLVKCRKFFNRYPPY